MQETAEDILEVGINYKGDKRTINMVLKNTNDLHNCEKGKIVVLVLEDGIRCTGVLNSIKNEGIELNSLYSSKTIGVKWESIKGYLEEVKD